MNTQYNSKHGIVSRSQAELYMSMVDLRNFVNLLPEDKRQGVQADYDTLSATVQGFTLGVRMTRREPYSYLELADNGAPFSFNVAIHLDPVEGEPGKTDFSVVASANLNFMMKMMLGNKIQEALDRIVDGLVDASNGKVPEGVPDDIKEKIKNGGFGF